MTRFSITLDEGVKFVVNSLESMQGGEVFIPKIPSYRIMDVAKVIAPDCNYNVVGVRPGEKLHEEMITQMDAMNSIEFNNYFIIAPNSEFFPFPKDYYLNGNNGEVGKYCDDGFSYNSEQNEHFLTTEELKKLIDDPIFKMISYGKQSIDQSDIDSIVDVLKGDWLTQGPYIKSFEDDLNNYFGSRYACAVSNGTGLHCIWLA